MGAHIQATEAYRRAAEKDGTFLELYGERKLTLADKAEDRPMLAAR